MNVRNMKIVLNGVQTIAPEGNSLSPVRVRARVRVGEQFSYGTIVLRTVLNKFSIYHILQEM